MKKVCSFAHCGKWGRNSVARGWLPHLENASKSTCASGRFLQNCRVENALNTISFFLLVTVNSQMIRSKPSIFPSSQAEGRIDKKVEEDGHLDIEQADFF